jgi:hypothetical protein
MCRAAAPSVDRRATTVAAGSGEGEGIQMFPLIPDIHRPLSRACGPQLTGQSPSYATFIGERCTALPPCFPPVIRMLVHRPGRFLHRAVPSFGTSPRSRKSNRFAAPIQETSGWNANDGVLLRRAHPRGRARRLDSIERRHLFHIRNTRCCAGDDMGAARRPRSVKQ